MIQSPADVLCRCPLRKFHPIGFQLCCNQLLRQVDLKFFCSAFHRFNHHDDSFLSKGFSYGESFIESIPYSQEKVDVNLVKKCTCLQNRTSTMLAGLPTGESPEFMSHSMRLVSGLIPVFWQGRFEQDLWHLMYRSFTIVTVIKHKKQRVQLSISSKMTPRLLFLICFLLF